MYTQCPQCMTYFQVTAEHLKIAQGNVRCGQCRNVFSALGNLTEKLPDMSNSGQDQLDSQHDEQLDTDFLTDEELGEFEEFDTNIYDDEDTVFDTMLQDDELEEELPPPAPVPSKRGNENLSKAIEKINQLNKESSQKLYGLDVNKSDIIEKLKQHESAIVEKLKQQEQEELQRLTQAKLAQTQGQERYSEPAAERIEKVAQTPAPAPQVKPEDTDVRSLRKSAKKKQDIPVQSSGEAVDIEDALQAIDQLDLTDESAQFIASVVEEFQSTQVTPQTPTSTPSGQAGAERASKRKRLANKLSRKKAKAKKQTPTAKPASTEASRLIEEITLQEGPINPDLIPTLPAILQEQFQQDAAVHHVSKGSIAWGVAAFLLMLVFLFQTVYFKHDQLARISQFRPWVEKFCKRMNCEVALQFNAKQLELLGQDIRTHPKVKDALMVSTTIINNASYTQAYPGLQITFSDLNGQKVAMRRFMPKEYLPKKTKIKKGMPSETPIQVEIELMDPGSKAVNFEFEFFKAS